jgi:hypothetical protein
MEVWNSAYKSALKSGSAKDAESKAFAEANGVVKESKSVSIKPFEFRAVIGIDGFDIKPQDCPASWSDEMKQAYCDGYNAAFDKGNKAGVQGEALSALAISGGMMGIHEMMTLPAKSGTPQPSNSTIVDTDLDNDEDELQPGRASKIVVEKRDASIEDFLSDLNKALATKFPYLNPDGADTNSCYPTSSYWSVETFDDHVIACASSSGPVGAADYVSIPYVVDDEGNVAFGAPTPVEKEWVPSDRSVAFLAELRDEFDDEEDDDEDNMDLFYQGRSHSDTGFHDNHMDGDCEERECSCQNRFAPTGSGMRSALPTGVEIRFDEGFKFEARSGMTRTKRVAGKDLSAASFAYVGDADKTETWKFPIFDAGHARNALARWGQAKGIPEGSKAGVLGKIHAAAKKFGITVADDRAAVADQELRIRLAEHMLRVGPDFKVTF